MSEEKNYTYIDALRIISMIAVVLLHAVSDNLNRNYLSYDWHFYNCVSSILSFAVPVFFMISGALILSSEKTKDIKHLFLNRLTKILVPLILWSGINIIVQYIFETRENVWELTVKRIMLTVRQPAALHLWFLYALIPLYLLSPLIKLAIDNAKESLIKYVIVIWIMFGPMLTTLSHIIRVDDWVNELMNKDYNLNLLNGYLGFFVLGYVLHKSAKKYDMKKLIGIFILTSLVIIFGTSIYQRYCIYYFEGFKLYNGIFSLVLAVTAFLIVKQFFEIFEASDRFKKFIKYISNLTFGIYLMHNLVIKSLVFYIGMNTIFDTIIIFVFAVLISLVITIILSYIPYVGYALTGIKRKKKIKI